MSLSFPFPEPPAFTTVSFFLFIVVGYVTRVFSKNLDEDIQRTAWFLRRGKVSRLLIKKALDLLHHWYVGWGLMVWADAVSGRVVFLSSGEIYWVGAAILLDDLPDIPRRVRSALSQFSVFGQLIEPSPR